MQGDMSFSATRPFDLPLLPPPLDAKDTQIVDLLLRARTELGELKGYSSGIPNPLLFLSPSVLRESVASSRIENINTTMQNVLQMQIFPDEERREPEKEVLHYREALLWGFGQLKKLPLSTRIVLGVHQRLLKGTAAGFRKTQNKIQESGPGTILYTPPPAQNIPALMGNLENFLHASDDIDPLVKSAIAHYQFEAIHPFGDGNGRTGRILMVLHLVEQNFLALPILYISGYINKHRNEYYRLLREVSSHRRWKEFVVFVLGGIYQQAKETKDHLLAVMTLYHKVREQIRTNHPRIYSADLVEAFFTYPMISPVALSRRLNIHYTTASRYLMHLTKAKILTESHFGKYHLFFNRRLLDILKR